MGNFAGHLHHTNYKATLPDHGRSKSGTNTCWRIFTCHAHVHGQPAAHHQPSRFGSVLHLGYSSILPAPSPHCSVVAVALKRLWSMLTRKLSGPLQPDSYRVRFSSAFTPLSGVSAPPGPGSFHGYFILCLGRVRIQTFTAPLSLVASDPCSEPQALLSWLGPRRLERIQRSWNDTSTLLPSPCIFLQKTGISHNRQPGGGCPESRWPLRRKEK